MNKWFSPIKTMAGSVVGFTTLVDWVENDAFCVINLVGQAAEQHCHNHVNIATHAQPAVDADRIEAFCDSAGVCPALWQAAYDCHFDERHLGWLIIWMELNVRDKKRVLSCPLYCVGQIYSHAFCSCPVRPSTLMRCFLIAMKHQQLLMTYPASPLEAIRFRHWLRSIIQWRTAMCKAPLGIHGWDWQQSSGRVSTDTDGGDAESQRSEERARGFEQNEAAEVGGGPDPDSAACTGSPPQPFRGLSDEQGMPINCN